MMQLYGARGCGSAIIEGVLALIGRPYVFVDVQGFDAPGSTREQLLAVNPLCQVPALVLDDGSILTETAAIVLHLSDRAEGLAPGIGHPDRPRFHHLLVWIVANLYPTFSYGDYPSRWTGSAPDELRDATDRHREVLYLWLDRQITEPFVLGRTVSALDIYIAVLVMWRPRQNWFERHTPGIARVAERTRLLPAIAGVMMSNGW